MRSLLLSSFWLLALTSTGACWANEGTLIDGFEDVWPWRPLSGRPTPALDLQEQGKSGKALRIRFPESREPQFAGRFVEANGAWNKAQGISFDFRGDGSDGYVSLSLIDDTLTKRYATLLSLRSKEWQRIRLRWTDFVPEVITADWMAAEGGNMKPSLVRAAWFGRWYYLRPWAACSFEVDDLRLEKVIEEKLLALPRQDGKGVDRALAKMKAGKDVIVVALGDSVTYGTNLKDRKQSAYPVLLQSLLRKKFENDRIRVLNRGVGGIETRQGIVLIPRDVASLKPDLVLVHFGYNDFSSMQGKPLSESQREKVARRNYTELVKRIWKVAGPQIDVLLIATIPGADEEHRTSLDPFGKAARKVAKELKCGYCEEPRDAFRKAWNKGTIDQLFVRLPNGRLDVAHPNEKGQQLFAQSLMKMFNGD